MSLSDEMIEATLVEIAFQYNVKTIVFVFTSADRSKAIRVTASKVVHFLGEDLREMNIVDFVRVHSGEETDDNSLTEALTHAFRGRDSDVAPPLLEQHFAMVRRRELVLLDFVPVCGASMMVLAHDIKVEITPA